MFLKKHFFFSATVAMITETAFVLFLWQPLLGKQIHEAYQSKLSLKDVVKQIKTTKEKMYPRCIFFYDVNDLDPSNKVKMQLIFFSNFYEHLSYT